MWLRLILDAIDSVTARRGRWFKFELAYLEAVRRLLSPIAADVMIMQLAGIKSIQRGPGLQDINLYFGRAGNVSIDHIPRFTNKSPELLLANVKLKENQKPNPLKVKIWIVRGVIFEFQYDQPLIKFFGTRDLDSVKPDVADIKIMCDPMLALESKLEKSGAPASKEAVAKFLMLGNVDKLGPPYTHEAIASGLEKFGTKFPADYVEFLELTDGASVDGCDALGLNGIRQVVFEERNFWIVAEKQGVGVLAVLGAARSPEIYFIDYIDEIKEAVGSSFVRAIQLLAAKATSD